MFGRIFAAAPGEALGIMLCSLIFGVLLGTFLGAILLRAGVALYNSMAGGRKSPNSVPEPQLGHAMGIIFVLFLVNGVLGFATGFVLGLAGVGANVDVQRMMPLVQLLLLPVTIVVDSALLSVMLPTTLGRAFLVWLCSLLVGIFVALVIGAILFAVLLGTGTKMGF